MPSRIHDNLANAGEKNEYFASFLGFFFFFLINLKEASQGRACQTGRGKPVDLVLTCAGSTGVG